MSKIDSTRPDEHLAEDEEKAKDKGSDNLGQKLLEARTVLVNGPVNDKMYESVTSRLYYLEYKDPKAEILVVVNSPGGSADGGFGIYNTMKFISCPIKTLCAGICASAGVLIYLGGDKGKRFTLPHSRFLLHQPSTQAFGQASDMEITANEILRTRKKYAEIVAEEIGSNADKVMADSNRDFWLTADEALKYKLVDKVITERKEL
ncbi:MAG: ATP-dependent Clp protease proteolytic subunit [Planctomycetota bacterium]|nr:ATP-dependent Clp protease proteolytic subunit [Planctomycetota bacterium]